MATDGQQKFIESYEEGDVIWHEDDSGNEMCIVKSGKVEFVRHMGDDDMVLKTLGPNEFFGEMALFGESRRTHTVRAASKTVIIKINKKMLDAQFDKVPEWLVNMINTVVGRIKKTSKGVKHNFEISLEYSIIKLIQLFLTEFGVKEEKGRTLNLRLVRGEIQKILGIGEDELDNCLKRLNIVNLIKIIGSKDKIDIPDEERLEKFSEYLILKSDSELVKDIDMDTNQVKSFDRIHKLLYR